MSKWLRPDDLFLDDDGEELSAYIFSDYDGAVYVSIPVKKIKELLEEQENE